jgi:hypothetical protein
MDKPSFKKFLAETPVGEYRTLGNWDKGSSFTSKRDRMILQHPRAIEILKKKFNSNDNIFNLFFLNSKEGRNHAEVGKVDLEWVRKNLGEEAANAVAPTYQEEGHVNIIYTNNKGEQGRPMTAWMVAHRMAHAFSRFGGGHGRQFPSYTEAMNTILWHLSQCMEEYGVADFPDSERKLDGASMYSQESRNKRNKQLIMKKFFSMVCTFRSAREDNIRDWFEVTNELFAQYVTTGKIKFNAPPQKFGSARAFGNGTGEFYLRGDAEAVSDSLGSLSRTLEYYFDELLSDACSGILVM